MQRRQTIPCRVSGIATCRSTASSSIRKASPANTAMRCSPAFSSWQKAIRSGRLDSVPSVPYTFRIRSMRGTYMLTRKQHELLLYINERLSETGVSPSFEEMKDALDLKSKSGVHRLISALEERGFIRRLPNRARALEILRLPDQIKATGATAPAK